MTRIWYRFVIDSELLHAQWITVVLYTVAFIVEGVQQNLKCRAVRPEEPKTGWGLARGSEPPPHQLGGLQ